MNTLCNREEEVVLAAINDCLDASHVSHLNSCEGCRAAIAMTSLFKSDEQTSSDTTPSIFIQDIIWTRGVYLIRQRRKRMRKLGLGVGAAIGLLAGYLTGVVAMPSNSAISLSQTVSILSHSLPLLWPIALIILAVLFVFAGNPVAMTVSKTR